MSKYTSAARSGDIVDEMMSALSQQVSPEVLDASQLATRITTPSEVVEITKDAKEDRTETAAKSNLCLLCFLAAILQ